MELLARRAWWSGLLALALLFALVLQVGYAVALILGAKSNAGPTGLGLLVLAAVALAVTVNARAYLTSDRTVLKLTDARLVSPAEQPVLHGVVDGLCVASGLPKPGVAVVDDPAPNAYATGRDPEHAVVVATTGLLAMLDRNELEAVMAHELGHVYNRDTLVTGVAAYTVNLVSQLSRWLVLIGWVAPTETCDGDGRRRSNGAGWFLVLGLVMQAVLVPASRLAMLAVSRQRETLADLTGVQFCRNPRALISALQKVTADPRPPRSIDPATAHLWFSAPTLGDTDHPLAAVSARASSHPDVGERLDLLARVEGGHSVDHVLATRSSYGVGTLKVAAVVTALVVVPAWFLGARVAEPTTPTTSVSTTTTTTAPEGSP